MHIAFELEIMSFKLGHKFLGTVTSQTKVIAWLEQFSEISYANTLLKFLTNF